MSILNNIEEAKNKKDARDAESEAVKLFKKQKDAIYDIKDTEGFRQIRLFFERQKGICEKCFRIGVKPDYSAYMQGKYELTCNFLDFIENQIRSSQQESIAPSQSV